MVVQLANCQVWNDDELNIVRLHYHGNISSIRCIIKLIKDKFGVLRTYDAVRHKATQLGLTRRKGYVWTDEQVAKLEQMAGKYTANQIASKLKRTKSSVNHKLRDLGLSGYDKNDWYSMKDVCYILGVSDDTFLRWVKSRKLKASYHGDNSNVFHVDLVDLKRFIIRYPLELTGRNVDMSQIVVILTSEDK